MSKAFDEWLWNDKDHGEDFVRFEYSGTIGEMRAAWNAALRHAAGMCRNEARGYNDNGIAQDALNITANQLEREAES